MLEPLAPELHTAIIDGDPIMLVEEPDGSMTMTRFRWDYETWECISVEKCRILSERP
jgi:hypothetical protein